MKQNTFDKEAHALNVIEDAIRAGVLVEGKTGGVMVYKEFENGSEGWVEVTKDFAAKDLVEQDKVRTLEEAIKNTRNKLSLEDKISAAKGAGNKEGNKAQYINEQER